MHFDGLQLDDQLVRRTSMPGQLKLVGPPYSQPFNALGNDQLILNQPKAPAIPALVINPISRQLQLILPAFSFAPTPPPPPDLPLNVNNPIANNANQLAFSPPAPKICAIIFVPHADYPPGQQHRLMPLNFVPSTDAPLPLPNTNTWRFPASVPANSMSLVGTSVNLNNVPSINPHVPTSLRSTTNVWAAVRSQTQVSSDFMQPNTFSSSTSTAPTFHSHRASNLSSNRCVWVDHRIRHLRTPEI